MKIQSVNILVFEKGDYVRSCAGACIVVDSQLLYSKIGLAPHDTYWYQKLTIQPKSGDENNPENTPVTTEGEHAFLISKKEYDEENYDI